MLNEHRFKTKFYFLYDTDKILSYYLTRKTTNFYYLVKLTRLNRYLLYQLKLNKFVYFKYDLFLISIFIHRFIQDLKDYMRQAGEVTYADAHKQRRNEG